MGGDRGGGGGGDRGGRGGGGGGDRGGRGGRGGGPGGMFGDSSTSKRYNLTLSLSSHNLFNHENFANPIGNLSSPLFGQSNSLGGGFGGGRGEGGSGAGNRRIEMRLMLSF